MSAKSYIDDDDYEFGSPAAASEYEQQASVGPFSDAERNAMRAYLQRCEVRLSTLHRVATAFISGAGLLLLIPIFFNSLIDSFLVVLLSLAYNHFESLGVFGSLLTLFMYGAVLFPLLLSFVIPLYGVYLLIKDLVFFYFTIYTPGFPDDLLNPTFALTGVMFSVDESPRGKQEVMNYQYKATQTGFMIPFNREDRELYFDSIIANTEGRIIPASRSIEQLQALHVLPEDYDRDNIQRMNAALGLARSIDRTLVQEVAVTELSLVRHVLYLRRLMLRYVKTLLMFIWTAVVSFLMLPFIQDGRLPPFIVFGVAYLIWALGVLYFIRKPLRWVYKHRGEGIRTDQIDPQLRTMERLITRMVYVAIGATIIQLVLAILALIR